MAKQKPKFAIRGATPEKQLVFFLEIEDGDVCLKATCYDGTDWYIANIRENGTLMLHDGIASDVGLSVTKTGKIKVTR